jgi:hypothetical protein
MLFGSANHKRPDGQSRRSSSGATKGAYQDLAYEQFGQEVQVLGIGTPDDF